MVGGGVSCREVISWELFFYDVSKDNVRAPRHSSRFKFIENSIHRGSLSIREVAWVRHHSHALPVLPSGN
jgi:hypothetical protein